MVVGNLSGGVYGGTVYQSLVQSNSGGYGVANAVVHRSVIARNQGRGLSGSTANNTLIFSNSFGGAEFSGLSHCTVFGNNAGNGGAGTLNCNVTNSIIQSNRLSNTSSYDDVNYNASGPYFVLNNSIGAFSPGGALVSFVGNFPNAPLFVNPAAGDFRLQPNSPGINDGTNIYVTTATDFDGNPRIVGGAVDVGAYEHQSPAFQMPYRWLSQYGLPANSSSHGADADGDGLNNYGEWRAGTNPTNAASVLRMISLSNGVSGILVSWQSVGLKKYWLERKGDLGAATPFQVIATNLTGATFTDTAATNEGPYFYRVGVQ